MMVGPFNSHDITIIIHSGFHRNMEESASHPSPPLWRGAPSLWINQFVWARVLCGARYYQSASFNCSGTTHKIRMRKFRLIQGAARACKCDGFHNLVTFDEAPGTIQSSGVRADTQTREYTTSRRLVAGQISMIFPVVGVRCWL